MILAVYNGNLEIVHLLLTQEEIDVNIQNIRDIKIYYFFMQLKLLIIYRISLKYLIIHRLFLLH